MSQDNKRSIVILCPDDLMGVITMREAIDLVEQGYGESHPFPIINAPRRRVHSRKNVRLSSFPGGIDGLGVIGALARAELVGTATNPQGYAYREHPVYVLWDSVTGHLDGIIIGEITEKQFVESDDPDVRAAAKASVMALRTAATSGVGIRHLARKDARIAGVYGVGGQALHGILALHRERPIEKFKVFSRNRENREAFCARMANEIGVDVVPVDEPRDVIRGSDIVICATNAHTPVFDGDWLEPGQHVVSGVGSNSAAVKGGWLKAARRETDDRTAERADLIVSNLRESVEMDQQANLIEPLQRGLITWDKIRELGEVVSKAHPGRTNDEQITFHANGNGTAVADLAIAKRVFDRCREMGRGVKLELPVAGTQ